MCTMMVECPNTGKPISTGIETDRATFDKLPDVPSLARCPHCGVEHSWRTHDAWLSDREPAWSPGPAAIEVARAFRLKGGHVPISRGKSGGIRS